MVEVRRYTPEGESPPTLAAVLLDVALPSQGSEGSEGSGG